MAQTKAQLISGSAAQDLTLATATVNAGSAASPSFVFSGDTNTGIFSPGADQVALATGGSGRLFINSSGNVGVGSSTITAANGRTNTLQVGTSGSGSAELCVGHQGGDWSLFTSGAIAGGTFSVAKGTTSWTDYYSASGIEYIRWNLNGSEKVRLTPTGLGIGTSSPGQQLAVATASGNCFIQAARASQSTGQVGVQLKGGTSGIDWFLYQETSTDDFRLWANGADKVTFKSSGNVGIGDTAPGYKLVVAGEMQMRGGDNTSFRIYNTTAGFQSLALYADSSVASVNAGVNNLALYSAGTERARIDSSGRLLVGTSSAAFSSSLLTVRGGVSSSVGDFNIASTGTNITSGADIAAIRITNTNGYRGAQITATAAGNWTEGSSQPTYLSFSTTGSGSSSPTERVVIDSGGLLQAKSGLIFTNIGALASLSNSASPVTWQNSLPIGDAFYSAFVTNQTGYPYTYGPLFGYTNTGNNSGYSYQLFHGYSGTSLYFRVGDGGGANTWGGWYSLNMTAVSDERVKENVVNSESTISTIQDLRVVDFDYTQDSGYNDNKRHKGLIAQEVLSVAPEVIEHMGDPDSEDTKLALKYEKLVPYLIKAIQEQQEMIAELKAEVAALKAQ